MKNRAYLSAIKRLGKWWPKTTREGIFRYMEINETGFFTTVYRLGYIYRTRLKKRLVKPPVSFEEICEDYLKNPDLYDKEKASR